MPYRSVRARNEQSAGAATIEQASSKRAAKAAIVKVASPSHSAHPKKKGREQQETGESCIYSISVRTTWRLALPAAYTNTRGCAPSRMGLDVRPAAAGGFCSNSDSASRWVPFKGPSGLTQEARA